MLLLQIILSFVVLGVVYFLAGANYLMGSKKGYDIGFADGVEYAQQLITEGIKQDKVTIDGKKVAIIYDEPLKKSIEPEAPKPPTE